MLSPSLPPLFSAFWSLSLYLMRRSLHRSPSAAEFPLRLTTADVVASVRPSKPEFISSPRTDFLPFRPTAPAMPKSAANHQ